MFSLHMGLAWEAISFSESPYCERLLEYSCNLQVATVEDYAKWVNITDPYVSFSGVYTAD